VIPRVIPCLLLAGEELVKTVRFAEPRYVRDPVNGLSRLNSFEVDEIVLLDIEATREERQPRFSLLEHLADECLIPLAYGGGVTTLEDVKRILGIGLEKVIVNTAMVDQPSLIGEVATTFGSQAIAVSIDAALRTNGGYDVYVEGGSRVVSHDVVGYARQAQELGAGELLLTSIDRDGTMEGYDVELVERVCAAVSVPVIACGGAGNRGQLVDPVRRGASAVAAGSLFVYQGRGRGVLINFPSRRQLASIFE